MRALIKMKDSERLELLKEIAGTRTYDERRKVRFLLPPSASAAGPHHAVRCQCGAQESNRIMEDTDKRRTQIDEVCAPLAPAAAHSTALDID